MAGCGSWELFSLFASTKKNVGSKWRLTAVLVSAALELRDVGRDCSATLRQQHISGRVTFAQNAKVIVNIRWFQNV